MNLFFNDINFLFDYILIKYKSGYCATLIQQNKYHCPIIHLYINVLLARLKTIMVNT